MYTNRRSNRTGTSIDFNLESHILWMEQARFNLKFGTLYENPNYSVFIELHYLLTLRENRKWISCRCWNSTRVFPFALFRFLCNGKKLFYPCFLNPVIVRALDDLCDRHCYLCISEAGRDLWLRSITNIMITYTHTYIQYCNYIEQCRWMYEDTYPLVKTARLFLLYAEKSP